VLARPIQLRHPLTIFAPEHHGTPLPCPDDRQSSAPSARANHCDLVRCHFRTNRGSVPFSNLEILARCRRTTIAANPTEKYSNTGDEILLERKRIPIVTGRATAATIEAKETY